MVASYSTLYIRGDVRTMFNKLHFNLNNTPFVLKFSNLEIKSTQNNRKSNQSKIFTNFHSALKTLVHKSNIFCYWIHHFHLASKFFKYYSAMSFSCSSHIAHIFPLIVPSKTNLYRLHTTSVPMKNSPLSRHHICL